MNIQISDPLALLPYQTGLVQTPLEERAARGQGSLDTTQRTIELGQPIPIVFGRRVDGVGGVFVSPGATEGRFENDGTTNELTVRLQLVLSEGNIPALQLRDVFQRACRVGTWKQSYDARTENWTPGNFVTIVAGKTPWNAPVYCGNGGSYDNLTTISYLNTHPDEDNTWNKQVHVFVREGMQVTRILDSTLGSSNNMIDLALYLIRQSSRFPEAMLDLTSMLDAARFTNANGFFYNGIFEDSVNLEDWLQDIAGNFLLRITDRAGKKAFRPRLPFNSSTGAIDTGAVSWVFTFTEEHVLPDGFEIEYIPLAERKPICALMLWRQQPDDDIGMIRSTEVRMTGEATNGPFEQYDLSAFCTSENHAVKVGAYKVARRKYISHTLRLRVKPDAYNSTLSLGDIVRVQLRRESTLGEVTFHDYLYEVERINRDISGRVELDLTHFPVDENGASLLALTVSAAVGGGYVLPTGRADFTCDLAGRRTDTTPLVSDPIASSPLGDFDYDVPSLNGAEPGEGDENPADPAEEPTVEVDGIPNDRPVLPGDTLSADLLCANGVTEVWECPPTYELDIPVGGTTVVPDPAVCTLKQIDTSSTSTYQVPTTVGMLQEEENGSILYFVQRCEDPGSPTGYASPIVSDGIEIPTNAAEISGLKTYTIAWQRLDVNWQYQTYTASIPYTPVITRNFRTVTVASCNNTSPAPKVTLYEAISPVYTVSVSAYGVRAYAANTALTFGCGTTPTFTNLPIILISTRNAAGEWSNLNYTFGNAFGPQGVGATVFGITGFAASARAINIAIT